MSGVPGLVLAAVVLCGCGGKSGPEGAAQSASRLLAAAVAGDRVAFEAEIDRGAVREDVRRQVAELARADALDVDGGPSEEALDRMISPAAIRIVHAGAAPSQAAAPSAAELAGLMRKVGHDRVCLRGRHGDCVLTFAREKRAWRLVGMKAMAVEIEVASAG